MRVYALTKIGESVASNPSNNVTPGMKVLYWLKRHGGQGSDEQISAFVFNGDSGTTQSVLNKLRNARAVEAVG